MKKSVISIVATLALTLLVLISATNAIAGGANANFQWTQAPDITWGTKIYIGIEPGVYTNSEDAGVNTTTYNMDNLEYGTKYYFTATHYDKDGFESDHAQEVSWTSPNIPGMNFDMLPEIADSGVKSYTITLTVTPN